MIGIWSTTDERKAGTAGQLDPANFAQVSRLGNPLVNEVVMPLALKDAFNTISPDVDATIPAAVDAVQNPRLPELINKIYGVPTPATPRNDLTEIFLQGISKRTPASAVIRPRCCRSTSTRSASTATSTRTRSCRRRCSG